MKSNALFNNPKRNVSTANINRQRTQKVEINPKKSKKAFDIVINDVINPNSLNAELTN